MNYWVQSSTWDDSVDIEVLEESALAMAQSTIQNAINESGISRSDLARRMQCHRSFVSRMLTGNHNLTVKTMARSMAACGFEVRFKAVPIEWTWGSLPSNAEEEVPANAGTTKLTEGAVVVVVPALDAKESVILG
jgi:transcriptional regulator with XRE-family HTH domain